MVRFPSSPEGDSSGAVEGEHLAPVTPLRRAAARERGEGEHPSRRGSARPVAELPGAGSSGVGSSGAGSPGAGSSGAGWNNTWGSEPPSGARGARAAAPDELDEETERQTRKATGVAIRQLARRGMSRWELEQLLTKREIDPEVFRPELDRLEALGVIDDASLAATLAFTQHSRKGLGRTAIEQELKRRHIYPELIESALADIGDEDELERATELAVKRIGQLSAYDDETARRRLHGFLARKGYTSDVVRQAMDAAFAGRRSRGGSGVRFQ